MQIELSIYPGNEMAVVNKLFKRCIEVDYRISYYQTHLWISTYVLYFAESFVNAASF